MDVKQTVARQFGAVAANYATSFTHSQGPDLDRLVERAKALGARTVLDAACGGGHTAFALAAAGLEVRAADITPEMVAQGRVLAAEQGFEIEFDVADVEALPYADGAFDLVTTRFAAHHFPHPAQAIAELMRVTRPGGALLLSDIVSFEDPTADTFLQAIEVLRDPSHVRDHRADEWTSMIASVGGRAELVATWPLHQPFEAWVERMRTPEPEVLVLRRLFDSAPAEARQALRIGGGTGQGFTLTVALIEARKGS